MCAPPPTVRSIVRMEAKVTRRVTQNRPCAIVLRMVPAAEDLPVDVKANIEKHYCPGQQPKGVLHKGIVYLGEDEHQNASET